MVIPSTPLRWFQFAMLWLVIPVVANAADLSLQLDKSQIELGKPLNVTLSYSDASPALESINLTAWRQYFYISVPPAAERIGQQQRLTLRLFAYESGEFNLAPLQFGIARTAVKNINVLPAVDPKDGAPIEFRATTSTTTPWLKQQVTIVAAITNSTPVLVLTTHESSQPALPMTSIPITTQSVTNGRYQHQIGWHVHSLRQGTVSLDNLFVYYQRDGIRTHRFVVRPVKLDVKPLPSYLPATIPVGQLALATPQLSHWLISGNIQTMTLQLRVQNMLAADIPDLGRQLQSTTDIHFHEAHRDIQRVTTVTSQQEIQHYQIPITTHGIGLPAPRRWRLQYFDPEHSQLVTINRSLPWTISLPGWLVVLLVIPATWMIYILVKWTATKIQWQWRRYRGYRIAQQQLHQAQTPQALRQVLQQVARTEGWPDNLTLQDWQQHWCSSNPGIKLHMRGLYLLGSALYSNQTTDIDRIRQEIMPLMKWRF